MGACDHPATSQPRRPLRFGSTLCYPAAGRGHAPILTSRPIEVEHVLPHDSSMPTACRSELDQSKYCDRIRVACACCHRVRYRLRACPLQWPHVVMLPTAFHCMSRACRRAIAPQDNARGNRGAATRTGAGLVLGNCWTIVTTSVHRIVIQQRTTLRVVILKA
ncbi:hypothetical protein MFFC18_18440 [Mariniblastus fucicola]|uniref:Uncharacterized protein n=1 Tax=Mariniblastus fucicola TaxID=980251 RepID=A0A5B9PGU7_9BACT|nr:hypothetical protein MFFC18_18440 [Mariniblastus fucicola]